MDENEKFYNKILAISTTILFIIVSVIVFIFIGIANVEAKSYTFTTTPAIRFTTGQTANTGTVKTCQNTIECWYSNNGDNVTNYVQYQYGVNRSNNSTDTHYEQETYILSFRARIVSLDTINKNNLIFRLYYYPNSNNEYGRAYCDGGESYKITYNNNSDNDVYVDYTCNEFAITSNVQYLVISIGATPNTIFGTQVSQNLKLIGPGDATNKDVINSIDSSTSTIVENNNSNTDKITEAIKGEGLENTTPINPNNKDTLEEVEDELLDENITTSLNNIDISIDTNSNEFIWNLITRIINTNSLIFGLVLTMLSLGVIKLVLNR